MTASLIHTKFIRQHLTQAVLTVLGLSGVVLIFLPFVNVDRWYVPVVAFLEGLEKRNLYIIALVGPFVVLPLFISAGYVRWLLTGWLSRWEGRLSYALALMVVAAFLLLVIQAWWESHFLKNWVNLFVFPALGLSAGGWFVIQNLRHRAPGTLAALVALQLAYLPFALFWLLFLSRGLIDGDTVLSDIGTSAYLAFLTAVLYTAQATQSLLGQPRLLLRLLPLGLVWVLPLAAFVLLTWLDD